MQKLERNFELAKASTAQKDLMNLILVKALFISPDVKDRCLAIHEKIVDAWADVLNAEKIRAAPFGEKFLPLRKEIAAQISALEEVMRAELRGGKQTADQTPAAHPPPPAGN